MTYRTPDAATLAADVRERSRKALAERLLARVPSAERSQMVAPVRQFTRDLNETQIGTWHILLDHQEAPRVPPPDPATEILGGQP